MFEYLLRGLEPGYRLRVELPRDVVEQIGPGRRDAKLTLEETGAGKARLTLEPTSGRVSRLTLTMPAADE